MLLVPWVQQIMSFFPFELSPGIYFSTGNISLAVSARFSGISLSVWTAIAPGMAPWDISTSSLMSTIRYESLSSSCISSIVISFEVSFEFSNAISLSPFFLVLQISYFYICYCLLHMASPSSAAYSLPSQQYVQSLHFSTPHASSISSSLLNLSDVKCSSLQISSTIFSYFSESGSVYS